MERNNRFLAWLLLGLAIYFFISSMRQQQSLQELAEQKKQQELQVLQTKRQEESKQLALKIAEENPGLTIPLEPPRQRWTLGTMNPTDGYRFLVTLDNRGAMIERVELVEQKQPGHFNFRSLHTKNIGGYLGYLAPEERSGGGVIIHSVPGGSAAATAICQQEQLT
ncbi:MAG: Membrane protein insertase YidC, partial [Planctomycetota bacterium]